MTPFVSLLLLFFSSPHLSRAVCCSGGVSFSCGNLLWPNESKYLQISEVICKRASYGEGKKLDENYERAKIYVQYIGQIVKSAAERGRDSTALARVFMHACTCGKHVCSPVQLRRYQPCTFSFPHSLSLSLFFFRTPLPSTPVPCPSVLALRTMAWAFCFAFTQHVLFLSSFYCNLGRESEKSTRPRPLPI